MKLVGQSETEWLELKAASYPEGGRFAQGRNTDDYRWNVAKAVIALANSIGGVVLLGVADDGSVVGLEASDPKEKRRLKGSEAFRRDFLEQVLRPPKGWRTGKQESFRLLNADLLGRLVALEEIYHGDQSVLAIFVDPTPKDYGFIEVDVSKDAAVAKRVVYVRKRGAVGEVEPLNEDKPDVLSLHERQRQQLAAGIPLVWKRFEDSGQLARSAEEILPDVRRHIATMEARLAPALARFTPLVAVERRGTGQNPGSKAKLHDDGDDWARSEAPSADESREVLRTEPEPRKGLVTELLGLSRRSFLIGEGGSGKSKCLEAFALDAARGWQPDQPWPLMVSLSAYSAEGLRGLLAAESGIDWEDLAPRIEAGELTLCLDGLNECPDMYYDQCVAEIAGILRGYPAAGLVLTSRTAQLPQDLPLETFALEPMDRECQNWFLAGYLGQPQQVAEVLAKLHLHAGGGAIASSPMLLRIAAEVARETDEIPTERSALYRRFLEAWFKREVETAQRGGRTLPWDLEQTINALAEFAFQARQRGSGRTTLAQAHALLVHRLGEDTEHFIDWASQGTILVRTLVRGDLAFEHETIQEYLCAEYLAARHEDIHEDVLALRADAKPGIWAMPLALTFEMIAQPSSALMDAAWKVEPLIVAAGTRSILDHRVEDASDDLWMQAVLNVLLGRDATAQARAISIIARLPPKYPISPYLLTSLHSRGFWYSALTHTAGTARIERLRNLVCGTDFPWIELLADALVGCESWSKGLSPALRAIAGTSPIPTLAEVLSSASVSELCALRRRNMISAEIFVSSWKTALDRSKVERLDLNLLDILRTEKKQLNDILRDMLPRYRAELRRIAVEPELSLRVLAILLRGGVVHAEELRARPGFLANVCARMSMMNALRLTRQGLLRQADIDAATRARLVYDRNTKRTNLKEALERRLLDPQDLPVQLRKQMAAAAPSSRNTSPPRPGKAKFTAAMVNDANSRRMVNAELAKTRWKVVLKRIAAERGFGFARHPNFEQDIFCLFSKISATDCNGLHEGQELDVRITVRFDTGRQRWGFAIESGRCVD